MIVKANAKINLSLDVVGKREDGYHELDMIFLEIGLGDILEVNITDAPGVKLTCSDPLLENEKNIAFRAAAAMLEKYYETRGVSIHIEKKIPMQAGLGGGSSDAAAVLKSVNELFGFGASDDELCETGVKLGADVPFFIKGGCARAKGIGEILTPIRDLPPIHLVIVKPDVGISTAYAYGNLKYGREAFHPDIEALAGALKKQDIKEAAAHLGNSLEEAVKDRYPVILTLKEQLLRAGACGSLMTGSGSAVFGIFEDEASARAGAEYMQKAAPEWAAYYCVPCTKSAGEQSV